MRRLIIYKLDSKTVGMAWDEAQQISINSDEWHQSVPKSTRILNTCSVFYLQLESELSDLMTQKDTEIADRETKLARLKKQLADSLTDNSR